MDTCEEGKYIIEELAVSARHLEQQGYAVPHLADFSEG